MEDAAVAPLPSELFVTAGGEMGARIRAFDWAETLGPLASWPQSLKTCVRIILTSRQPMFVWWGKDLINLYNDAYRAIVGGKHPEALGQPASLVWREIWDQVYPRALAALRGNEGTYDEALLLIMERNGYPEETYYTFSYSPVPGDDGTTAGIICANTDDTQRIVGERRLNLLRELAARPIKARTWQEACASSADAFAINARDLPFGLIYVADPATGVWKLIAQSGFESGHAAAPAEIPLQDEGPWPLDECIRTGEITLCSTGPASDLPRGDWDRPPTQAALVPLTAASQTGPSGVLIVGLNPYRLFDDSYRGFVNLVASQIGLSITTAHAYEQERQRAEALAEIDRVKTTFFSNVSHEFRTPLTLIVGPAEDAINHEHAPPEVERERWHVVHRNALRLLKLVNALLDFSRIEAGRAQAAYVQTELSHLTAELASAFRSAIERAGLRFTVDCQPLSQPVFVDQDMYEKIVLNLLSNALKFTFSGEIVVTLGDSAEGAVLSIRDTGTGIPEAELPHVFERFHRVQGARSRTHEGSGIGLALVNELVRLHGGTITVASELERGTTFSITLPYGSDHLPAERIHTTRTLTPPAGGSAPYVQEALRWLPRGIDEPIRESTVPSAHAEVALSPALDATSSARIVLADDNADMREYVTRLLSVHWEVEAVADGEEALAAVRRRLPELLLTDVMMPNLDGFGLLRAMRADPDLEHVPVIMLSARAGEESRVEGLRASADDYLVKPFSARELLARVATHLALGRARSDARNAHGRLRSLFEQAPVGVSVVRGPDLMFELTNARYEQAVGRKGLVGKTLQQAFPELPPDWPLFSILREVRERGVAYAASEYKVQLDRTGSGRLEDVFFMFRSEPIREPDGSVDAIMTVVIDVTSQVRMRREIEALSREREILLTQEQQLRAAAEAANRSKDEFLAMLGHELRNPLAPILTALHLMRLRHPELSRTERTVIERQVEHLVRLVDDLLDIARVTGGKIEIKKSTVELSELVTKAVELASPLLEQRRHTLQVQIARGGLRVHVDTTRITQVIANLLINSAKYTEPGGSVALSALRLGEMIELTVADSGLGISPEMLPRVFDPFVQETQASDRPQGGLGLGLAIVKSLVALHGGSVAAHSAGLGRGSNFMVRLPAAPDEMPAATSSEGDSRLSAAPTTKLRVMIVDDNADAAEMLGELVTLLGHEVRVVHDGPSALDLVSEFTPHVGLLDIGLPVMDGFELARRIRELPKLAGIRLIAATGYGQDHDRARSKEAGFDLHFVKPIDLKQLANALEAVPAG